MAKQQVEMKNCRFGITPVGGSASRAGVAYRTNEELGCSVLTEAYDLAEDPSDRKQPHGIGLARDPLSMSRVKKLKAELANTAAEVLISHLSNYVGSKDKKGKVSAEDPEFASFVRQSIVGTDPIIVDTALHAQMSGGGKKQNIAKLEGKSKNDPDFGAVGINETLPSISCNLEVVVLHSSGAHIAHRGQSRQYLVSQNGIEQLTRDCEPVGLLSSLNGTGNLPPEPELKSVELGAKDHLVVISNGCLPKGDDVNLNELLCTRATSPQRHAEAINRRIAKYRKGGGYIIVVYGPEAATVGLNNMSSRKPSEKRQNKSHKPEPKTKNDPDDGAAATAKKTTLRPLRKGPPRNTLTGTPVAEHSAAKPREIQLSPGPKPDKSAPTTSEQETVVQKSPPTSSRKPDAPTSQKLRSVQSEITEDTRVMDPNELHKLRGRMKEHFESKMEAFEEEMCEMMEARISAMEKRFAEKLIDAETSIRQEILQSEMSIPPPLPYDDATSNQDNHLENYPAPLAQPVVPAAVATDPKAEKIKQEVLQPEMSMPPPLPYDDATSNQDNHLENCPAPLEQPVVPAAVAMDSKAAKEAQAGRWTESVSHSTRGLTTRALAWMRALGLQEKCRMIGDRLALIQISGRHPFARRWVAPTTILILIGLTVLIIASLGTESREHAETLSGQVEPSAVGSVTDEAPDMKAQASAEPSGALDRTSDNRNSHEGYTEYRLGPPKNRDQAYTQGRRLYVEGDSGRAEDGSRLTRDARVQCLLGALPYFEYAHKADTKAKISDPDLWFLEARCHYVLAKLRHDRANHATAAMRAFQQHEKLEPRSPKRKKKMIQRNMSTLGRWLEDPTE